MDLLDKTLGEFVELFQGSETYFGVSKPTGNKNSKGNFSITKNGVYDVKTQYSDTLIYERNLISSLTDEIADEIVDNILVKFNDL